jgi:hypothetical protein
MTNNLAMKWAEPSPRFSYPEKEQAVLGVLAKQGFKDIPRAAMVEPEAFSSTVGGVFYAAAYALQRAGRPVGHFSILDAVERNRHWLKLVEAAAKEEGRPDWRDYLNSADDSLAYNPQVGEIVAEMLEEIAAAAAKRRAVEVGRGLLDGSLAPEEAAKALQESNALCASAVERHSIKGLFAFEPKADPSTLLGNRWVCKGGQLLLVGQSGVGKSSLTVQAAMTWALGLPFFGIKPARPLKSLYIQAENDEGDMAEIVQGVMSFVVAKSGMPQEDALRFLNENLEFVRVTAAAGEEFGAVVRDLVRQHPVDLVFGDPLLSFVGDDISQQSVASRFLRGVLNPIAFEYGFAWVWSHHTGKPQSDSKARAHWNANDFAYIGLGSSELTNWARAICLLQTTKHDGIFKLLLTKRGRRADICDSLGHPTIEVVLKHADQGLHWEPAELPEEQEQEQESKHKGRPPALSVLQEAELIAMQSTWPQGQRGFYTKAAERFKVSKDTIERFFKRQNQKHENAAAK